MRSVLAILGLSPTKPANRQNQQTETTWSSPDLFVVVTFCLIGLLLTLNLVLRFPDLGSVIEQYNLF
jgi:hypothetical protein